MVISQKNRAGYSKITSVSVSKEMLAFIEQYDLSPTEIFRKGMGVMLHDIGKPPYSNSVMNTVRSDYVKQFINNLKEQEELSNFSDSLKELESYNKKFHKVDEAIDNINRILKKMEGVK